MRSNDWWVGLCATAFLTACAAGMSAQAGSTANPAAGANANTIAGQIAAGKAAAGNTWIGLFGEMCGGAMGAGGRASSILPPAGADSAAGRGRGRQAGPPPREQWYHDPVKMFDNVYGFSTDDVMSMAITTSAGIILIDATYDYSVKDLIVDAMPKVGLDPKDIKYAVITHFHGDHLAGAKYLQDNFGTRIVMSDTDWAAAAQPSRGGLPAAPTARKDMIATEGQQLTLGDTTITLYSTPGHTAGTTSMIIPVKDKGVTHYAALWGGTSISTSSPYDLLVGYTASARKMRDLAARAGADVILSPHGRVIEFFKRANSVYLFPSGANPFIEGRNEVKNFFDMAEHCSQAVTMAQTAAKK
ncbi:MAG TPA: MBL fold metallo-hydrolase [Vicinamibacterales bacterium]|jgi:metallo-beta-lactamase class B|nr:MBL fold metallo-hydrolase [Vicinamibacterales bacterium]